MPKTYKGVDLKNALKHYGRSGMKKGRHLPGTTWWQEAVKGKIPNIRPQVMAMDAANEGKRRALEEEDIRRGAEIHGVTPEEERRQRVKGQLHQHVRDAQDQVDKDKEQWHRYDKERKRIEVEQEKRAKEREERDEQYRKRQQFEKEKEEKERKHREKDEEDAAAAEAIRKIREERQKKKDAETREKMLKEEEKKKRRRAMTPARGTIPSIRPSTKLEERLRRTIPWANK